MYVNEIFTSISGEVGHIPQGSLVTFLRLQKCNLKCSYCDTPESQKDWSIKQAMSNEEIIGTLQDKKVNKIIVTGGEPLLQQFELNDLLEFNHFYFQIETNGSILWKYDIPHNLSFVVDYKFEYEDIMNWKMFQLLTEKDYIKIVIANEEQYKKAKILLKIFNILCPTTKIAFSPVHGKFDNLADLIIRDNLDVIYNMQIHKFIGVK